MHSAQLEEWLTRIRKQHVKSIDLSLERVRQVAERLDLLKVSCPVITVGGTNGKGSTVAGLEAIYLAAGYRTGTFTSPYLYRFNEEIKLNGLEISDQGLIQAFEVIENARGDTTLTVFEFNTLTALWLFREANLDVVILEVGLGGRFDAVNIVDADISIVTSIGIDHVDWLGDTREKIGFEKAGIFRAGKPAICGDFEPPTSLVEHAKLIEADFYCQGKQFGFEKNETSWTWSHQTIRFENLPLSRLLLQNMSTVLMAVELLQKQLPVNRQAIEKALAEVTLSGRIQVKPGPVTTIVDVSHNPAAAALLADYLEKNPTQGKTRAVFSMLVDKDIVATIKEMKSVIDEWHVAPLNVERGSSLEHLQQCFMQTNADFYKTIPDAYQTVKKLSQANDRIVIFGSFYTVAQAPLL